MRVGNYDVLRAEIADELGRGASGTVCRGLYRPTGSYVAVKQNVLDESTPDKREHARKYILNEITILLSLQHENVVKLFHYEKLDGYLFLFLELCTEGDLVKYVKKQKELSLITRISFMKDISRALRCLHGQSPPIIHRDIKPENLLVTKPTPFAGPIIKITDFAFSCRAHPGSAAFTATAGVGTLLWMAPEVHRHGRKARYNIQADIFSAGLVYHAIIEYVPGDVLHALSVGEQSVGQWMHEKHLLDLPVIPLDLRKVGDDAVKSSVKQLVQKMLQDKPAARCRIQDVCTDIDSLYKEVAALPAGEVAAARVGGESAASHFTPLVERHEETMEISAGGSTATSQETATGATAGLGARERTGARDRTGARERTGATAGLGARERTGARARTGANEGAEFCVRKMNTLSLKVTDQAGASLSFGPTNVILSYANDPDLYYYKFHSDKYKLIWQKKIPDGLEYDDVKELSVSNDIYIHYYDKQGTDDKVCQFNEELQLIRTLPSPGIMIGLLPDGLNAVVSNDASPSTVTDGIRLSVAPVSNLHAARYNLDIPDAGAYRREDKLYACGRQDGSVTVIAWNQPFADFYNAAGRYICRTQLPHGAAKPGCSDTRVLIPLAVIPPHICVLSWDGHLLQTLKQEHLSLSADDWFAAVSPVYEGRLSVWTSSPAGASTEHKVHTYKIV